MPANKTKTPIHRALSDLATDFVNKQIKRTRVYVACLTAGEIKAWAQHLRTLHPDHIIVEAYTKDEFSRRVVETDARLFNIIVTNYHFMLVGWHDHEYPEMAIVATSVLSEPEAVQLASRSRGNGPLLIQYRPTNSSTDENSAITRG